MPHFHPPIPPHFLSERMRDAERAVWESLQQLDYSWHVFYSPRENSGSGWDREIDFVLIRLNRIFYCEVKGGIVVVDQRAGPGVTWAHFTRSREPIRKRVDPTQLWTAKAALGETIRQIAGQTPREIGFREHDVYIFPHTPRQVTQGADVERDYIHYVFEEEIATLPMRLQQIIDTGKGRFIDRARIESIIDSLKETVVRERDGSPPPVRPVPWPRDQDHKPFATHTLQPEAPRARRAGHIFWPLSRSSLRLPRPLKITAAVVMVLAATHAFQDLQAPPPIQHSEPTQQPIAQTVAAPRPPPVPKESTRKQDTFSALPSFIPAASAEAVERAITSAKDVAVYVSWQNEAQHGFVILRSDDGDGCRRYQISRHDLPSTRYETVRRCSELQQ